jgi:hypothetical protein
MLQKEIASRAAVQGPLGNPEIAINSGKTKVNLQFPLALGPLLNLT